MGGENRSWEKFLLSAHTLIRNAAGPRRYNPTVSDEIRRPPGRAHPPASELEEEARRLERGLAAFAGLVRRQLFGAGGPAASPLDLHLDLRLDLGAAGLAAGGEPLAEQVTRAVRAAAAEGESFHPGRVYCYRCENSLCEHSVPPRPPAVFAGYGPTGVPQWADLAQFLLDCKDARVEELFQEPPAAVARVFYGRELKGRQLHPFGRASKRYDLLGQLVAGYFGSRQDALSAVTVQAVESRQPGGRTRIVLNVVGSPPADPAFSDALRAARLRVQAIEEDLARPGVTAERRSELLRRIPGWLREMGRSVERASRQHGRRTRHAEERRGERRPTQSAERDAREAADASIYADEERGTLIVVGPRGRVHAFTPDGRHVTSLTLDVGALSRRLRQERWRPARKDEIAMLRKSLAILNR